MAEIIEQFENEGGDVKEDDLNIYLPQAMSTSIFMENIASI